ncbi:ATP-binding cassette domain-containing protein [Paraclostridium sordellii]|uniref:ATP-binding cassette domain-containing protein n=1 Tax=Paraclostridium sordellii TaxID=1505 RepID=UPI0009BFDFBF|nr:ABC transporter ATP-binding protein [Paeniclostridium sordellii]
MDRLDKVNSNFKHNYDKKHLNLDNTNIFKNSLIFENVNFKYNDDSPILEGFNAEFHKSKINILLGDSGLGKSTIFKLILRFYELQDGSILIGKLNIKNIPQDYIRKNIAYVPQNPYFFNVSIYDNIRYANPQISYGEVNNILKMVNLYDFISSLPQGIETVMQESGDNFSEGQKQRLNIARAIAKNPQIYLFDEPTSALDQENRNGILNIIHRLSSEKTVIMITHDREVSNIFDNSNVIEINNSLADTV